MSGSASPDLTDRSAVTVAGPAVPLRLAAHAAVASAVIGGVGVAFLVGMFTAFAVGARSQALTLGWINDILVLVSYPLVVPAALVIRSHVRPVAPLATDVATAAGLAAVGAIAVLQALLLRGDLTFEEQIGPISIAFLAFGAWLVVIGRLGARSGLLPGGVRMGLLGATYVGYPAWALWAARRLGRATTHPNDPSDG